MTHETRITYTLVNLKGDDQAMKQKKTTKEAAYNFLKQLEKRRNGAVPPPMELKSMVDALWQKPKHLKTEREKIESKENIPFFS